ncbi:hypothetical protein [Streptomyces sp. URMC 123]|uniref:hypothetical protein n=1 Tax=Streptomyces sp. URMC 123 TaxID=3423403 RepID=UPI003F1BC181
MAADEAVEPTDGEPDESTVETSEQIEQVWEFDPVPGVLRMRCDIKATPGENWSASVDCHAYVKVPFADEKQIGQEGIELSKERPTATIHPGAASGLVTSELEVGFYGPGACFAVRGWIKVGRASMVKTWKVDSKSRICLHQASD